MKRWTRILLLVGVMVWICGCGRKSPVVGPIGGGDPPPPAQPASPGFQIDWGGVPEYFALDGMRSEPQRMVDPHTGEVVVFSAVVFTGVARQTMYTPLINVEYCDAQGVKLRSGVVQIDNASFQIQAGKRVRGWFGIPPDLPNIRLIRLTPL